MDAHHFGKQMNISVETLHCGEIDKNYLTDVCENSMGRLDQIGYVYEKFLQGGKIIPESSCAYSSS